MQPSPVVKDVRRAGSKAAVFCLALVLSSGQRLEGAVGDLLHWQPLPPLPDVAGLAGPFAGASEDALIVAGGCHAPPATDRPGAAQQWYDTVFVLDAPDGSWRRAGRLPLPLAHGLSLSTRDGVFCAGGADGSRHHAGVFLLRLVDDEIHTTHLPDLPRRCAFLCGGLLGQTVYAAGGLDATDASTALRTFWALDLSAEEPEWQQLEPWPGPERMMAVAAIQDDSFFLIGGVRLRPGAKGQVVREYLSDGYRYAPGQGWRPITAVPRPVAGAPSPAPALGPDQLVLLGGDDGAQARFPTRKVAAYTRQVLVYDTQRDAWTVRGQLPFSCVATPLVSWRGYALLAGGESQPGMSVPHVWAGEWVQPAATLPWLDWSILAGAAVGLAMIGTNLVRCRRQPLGPQPGTRLSDAARIGFYPWALVGLLWIVAVLNYVDRQVIYSVFPLLQADLHLSNVQLGLISSVFLWVYGLLSPFSGFLSDRYGRKRIIVCSLLVWSVVTWLTGKVSNFGELLGTRALMGVSEACYLPAALALIVSYHGNRSRSLASGLHHSGLYVGVVLGGAGGSWLGQRYGWRWPFLVLGAVGVLYVMLLTLLLREPRSITEDSARPAALGFGEAVRELIGLPGYAKMALVFSAIATANCVLYTWLPLYLYQHFRLDLTAAGFSATFYIAAASLAGIVAGGWLADRLSHSSQRGRLRTQALGLWLAAPALALIGTTASVGWLIVALVLFGLGRGFYDCNVMPVLCQVARSDLRATGYGVFNLAGCLAGGGVALLAGALKETVGLGTVFQLTGLLLLVTTFLIGRVVLPVAEKMAPAEVPL